MRAVRAIGLNLLGAIAGIIVGDIVYKIAVYIFIGLLGQVKWLTTILSWPVPYDYYALTGIAAAHAASSTGISSIICKFAGTKRHYGNIVVGLYGVASYISLLAMNFSESGFSFKILMVFLVMISFFIAAIIMTLTNEDY